MKDANLKYIAFGMSAIQGTIIGLFTRPLVMAFIICILGILVAVLLAIYENGTIYNQPTDKDRETGELK